MELYVNGSLNVFNHQTNVDIHNRLVCFDIKELGTQLRKLGMLIVQDQVWNRVTINRSEGKATRYYIDEFHLLLKEEQTAAYSVEIWKRFRKWGGIPTGITQNVKDLLSSREVENIFENSDFVYMLNQAQGDREILAKQLNISQQQMTYVTHSDAGEGLIFYGNVILPFIDRFPQDTELYRVMTTQTRRGVGMRIEMDKIYCGDSLQVLQTLPENAVDCCVTSPPYYALRDYGADGQIGREATPEEYVSRITAVFHEVKRGAYAGGYLLAEYRGHLLRHRQQSRPPRPQIPQRQERAASGV